MRPPSIRPNGRPPINMTPMIDVVFLLIVFFIATSTMVRNEFSQNVELPVAESGKDRQESPEQKKVTASILPNGEVYVSGRRTTPEAFRRIIQAELAQHSAERIEVQFRADQTAPYGAVEELLLLCARSGVWQVSFAVQERND